jgi:hypothetical protein
MFIVGLALPSLNDSNFEELNANESLVMFERRKRSYVPSFFRQHRCLRTIDKLESSHPFQVEIAKRVTTLKAQECGEVKRGRIANTRCLN